MMVGTLVQVLGFMLICDYLIITGGCNIEGEDDGWDFGSGAGFYVDATQDKWKTNYRMYSYVTQEVGVMNGANM